MNSLITRRRFLARSGTAVASLTATLQMSRAAESAADKIVIGVMGTNGRGLAHIEAFLAHPNTEVGYVCDVDERAIAKGLAAVSRRQQKTARGVKDVRQVLEDKNVDVLTVATPNHWHAPATILACAAGKHVYVEKPGSHNPHEGALMVAAARKHDRVVQMGTQRRSWPWMIEAMAALKAGEIGKVCFARTWYNSQRGSIGRGQPVPVPAWLDYTMWEGPAPHRPYKDNLVHYNWHWLWHWGNGELGNNGIHALDIARWGLEVDCPVRVTCGGNRYHFADDQETPDIYITTFDFGEKGASWESHSCDPRGFEGEKFGITFYGERGTMVIAGNNCRIYDLKDKVVREIRGRGGDTEHVANFLECIRDHKRPNADIGEGQKSTLLCHLGNIAYRTGRTLNLDAGKRTILGDPDALRLWRREYRAGWEPQV